MMHDDDAVAGQMDVELETIGAERQAVIERRDRLLRPERRAATMGKTSGRDDPGRENSGKALIFAGPPM